MPPSRLANVQGRQKSCTECVKAKRKCDTGQPRCARCRKQNLPCAYPTQCKQISGLPDTTSGHSGAVIEATSILQDPGSTILPLDPDILNFAATLDEQTFDFDTPFGLSSENLFGQTSGNVSSCEQHLNTHDPQRPLKSPAFSWANISPASRSRVGYAIEQLKLAPQTMVASNSTLWFHAMFYEEDMPMPMQDAYAACALYNARNSVNAEFVGRHIANRVAELIAMPLPTSPTSVIARAHALMLYHVMLILSDDVRFFSLAGATVQHLEEVGYALLELSTQQTDHFDSLPLYPSTTAHAAWKSFINRESLRRTVLSLYQLVAVSSMLLGGLNSCAPSLSQGNLVTVSAQLWQAKSTFEFATIWNKKQHFLVHELDFTDLLANGRPDDLDNFAKTMLVGLHGIDDIKGWLYERDGTF